MTPIFKRKCWNLAVWNSNPVHKRSLSPVCSEYGIISQREPASHLAQNSLRLKNHLPILYYKEHPDFGPPANSAAVGGERYCSRCGYVEALLTFDAPISSAKESTSREMPKHTVEYLVSNAQLDATTALFWISSIIQRFIPTAKRAHTPYLGKSAKLRVLYVPVNEIQQAQPTWVISCKINTTAFLLLVFCLWLRRLD